MARSSFQLSLRSSGDLKDDHIEEGVAKGGPSEDLERPAGGCCGGGGASVPLSMQGAGGPKKAWDSSHVS